MMELVTDETRMCVASSRGMASSGRVSTALESIQAKVGQPALPIIDQVTLHLTTAELLYLDGNYSSAHAIFTVDLDPLLDSVPQPISLVIGLNRVDVASRLFIAGEMDRFYDFVDELELADIEHWDESAILRASRSAAQGKSYESLPIVWRELRRTYRQGRWAAFRRASASMAEECIRIGAWPEAAFHAAVACDDGIAKQLASLLLAIRSTPVIEQVIQRLILTANLQAHFKTACVLIQDASEGVPESQIDPLIRWILLRCGDAKEPEDHGFTEQMAWKTIECLASRASAEVAKEVVSAALKHRAWTAVVDQPNQFIRGREEIVDAVNQIITSLPLESLEPLADSVLPLATVRHNPQDFVNVVNVLGHIAHRASESVRERIKIALYPPNKQISPILMQFAPLVGQEIANKNEQLDKYAETIAQNLGKVVQRVPNGEQPAPVHGTLMTFTSTKEHERLLVHFISCDDVRAMARNRKAFKPESIRLVVLALAAGIGDSTNSLDNRLVYIDCVKEFADCFDEETAKSVFEILSPIAAGTIDVSSDIPIRGGQANPLSRMNFNGASKEQVSGHALFVAACIERCLPGVFGDRLQKIVEPTLSSSSGEMRKMAFAAVREIPRLAESTWIPLLLATRDPDIDAAALAFDAISNKKDAKLSQSQWRMIAYALRTAHQSLSIKLRRGAARAVTALIPLARIKSIRKDLEQVRRLFEADIAYSVRKATSQQVEE